MLIRLDKLSKDIGLFPQSAKIAIHRVTDIEEELKSVSRPQEEIVGDEEVDQEKVCARIKELTPRYKVENPTRFRYVLAHAQPNATLLARLWRIYERAPEYYTSLARFIEKYEKLPTKAGAKLLQEIKSQDLYPAIAAEFLRVGRCRLRDSEAVRADALLKPMWQAKSRNVDLLAYLGCWLIERGRLTHRQTEYACVRVKSWWARTQMVSSLNNEFIGEASLAQLANKAIRDKSSDVSLAAAMLVVREGIAVATPRRDLNPAASAVLKEFGIIRRGGSSICGIKQSLGLMSGANASVNWKVFFGTDYRHAERQIVECRGYATTNATAWVSAMDVFLDLLLSSLYRHDGSLGTYNVGGIGSVLGSARLKAIYPQVQEIVESIHLKRYGSLLSHAKEKRTGKPTKAVRFSYLRTGHRLVRGAIGELSLKF
jgi:hypothetical protein